ncbi:hypothetical protein SAMN05518672_11577 [Chitinophaga sp. CF118]|uniref:hypothetical protein n=1 Tax=Chitinophaga sp. CF118 TaxID=1884367 RepID=UPI0008E85FF9|nr:hypothetical protein [Chitinophaga sp. CF118]SFF07433.1 hypothetical protein SAMN05518672_11577 [Chitinophaga sp. CF118]
MNVPELIKSIGSFITVISVVVGIVISVMNFRIAKEKEAESRKIEAAKPFLELRQKLYLDALNNASILASKDLHTEEEVAKAKKRFSELYWGELSLIEESEIEGMMMAVARAENLTDDPTPTQIATYNLAHTMRESLTKSWQVDTAKVGKINP